MDLELMLLSISVVLMLIFIVFKKNTFIWGAFPTLLIVCLGIICYCFDARYLGYIIILLGGLCISAVNLIGIMMTKGQSIVSEMQIYKKILLVMSGLSVLVIFGSISLVIIREFGSYFGNDISTGEIKANKDLFYFMLDKNFMSINSIMVLILFSIIYIVMMSKETNE